jgi:hypothetical protein
LGILGAAAHVENADLRALFVRILHALGQLKMGLDHGVGHLVLMTAPNKQ